jgi:hypothetical protein
MANRQVSVRSIKRAGAVIAACCLTASLATTAPARADSNSEALANAVRATYAAAAAGIDVEELITYSTPFSLRDSVPRVNMTLRAGSRLRFHITAAPDGSSYTSVRLMPSGRLLGAAGVDPVSGEPWATVSMLLADAQARARRAGLSSRTALIGVSPDDLLSDSYVTDPSRLAVNILLPPYANSGDEGWSTIETIPQPDGGMIIRGSIAPGVAASDGEDRCRRPLVEMTVGPDMVVRSSRWQETCPRGDVLAAGTRTYQVTAQYGPLTPKGPTSPSRPASVLD